MICTALTAYLWLCRACELQTAAADTSKASAVQCRLVRRQDLLTSCHVRSISAFGRCPSSLWFPEHGHNRLVCHADWRGVAKHPLTDWCLGYTSISLSIFMCFGHASNLHEFVCIRICSVYLYLCHECQEMHFKMSMPTKKNT